MKKLGLGCMRLPTNDGIIDLPQVKQMVDEYLAAGFTYFDTAYMYHGGKSETTVREALVERYPRESFLLADKMPCSMLEKAEDVPRIFAEQLERCGVAYFDYYLAHALSRKNYDACQNFHVFEYMTEQKKAGKIRHIGFSFHDSPETLEQILTDHPEVEFVQLQINYLDWESSSVAARKCYEIVRSHGKEVIIMEPVKGGTLARMPEKAVDILKAAAPDKSPASWAMRFALGLEGVLVVLSGMSDLAQLRDNMQTTDSFAPFTAEEQAALVSVTEILDGSKGIACTACRYCVEGCPQNIAIADLFSAYNAHKLTGEPFEKPEGGAPAECVRCRKCEKVCPQHLKITMYLKTVGAVYEK